MRLLPLLMLAALTAPASADGVFVMGMFQGQSYGTLALGLDAADAESRGLDTCRMRGVTECHVAERFRDTCLALYKSTKSADLTAARGSSSTDAGNSAKQACERRPGTTCVMHATVCDDATARRAVALAPNALARSPTEPQAETSEFGQRFLRCIEGYRSQCEHVRNSPLLTANQRKQLAAADEAQQRSSEAGKALWYLLLSLPYFWLGYVLFAKRY